MRYFLQVDRWLAQRKVIVGVAWPVPHSGGGLQILDLISPYVLQGRALLVLLRLVILHCYCRGFPLALAIEMHYSER